MALGLIGIVLALTAAPQMLQGLTSMFPPFAAMVQRKGMNQRPDLLPTVEQSISMRIRGELTDAEYYTTLRSIGLDTDYADKLLTASQRYLSAYEYISLWRREKMNDHELSEQLAILGLKPDQQERAKQATEYYPNPDDIVRFAVREVYTPDIVKKYGLDEDLPDEYLQAAKMGGLSEDFARNYWRAHWELPSPNQVFEMFHRGLIDKERMLEYLRTADYMPAWREEMIGISYNPINRIDLRRMYRDGSITEEEVYNGYLELGQKPENARKITDWVVRTMGEDVDTSPRSLVLQRYRQGTIDRAEATTELEKLGISDEIASTFLDVEDDKIKWETIDLASDSLIDQFNNGDFDIQELRIRLTELGVPERMLNTVIAREQAQAKKRIRRPTKTDYEKWLKLGIIDIDQYRMRMNALGYKEDAIELYLQEIALDIMSDEDKLLPRTTYVKFFREGRMSEAELREKLGLLGYNEEDTNDLVAQAKDKMKG